MADKIPVKAIFTGSDTTGLGEFNAGDTLGVAFGGTSSTTLAGFKTLASLNNVENTADLNKVISTATQTALNGKQASGAYASGTGSANGVNTGDETLVTIKSKLGISTLSGSNTGDQTIPTTLPASDVYAWAKDAVKPAYIKTEVGLGNVDNTSDLNKPISTVTQTALNLKADSSALSSHTGNASNPHSVTKSQVGLGNVDNTSDLAKPISTLTQTAINDKTTEAYVKASIGNLVYNGLGALRNNSNFSGYTFDATQVESGAGSFRVNVASGARYNDDYIPVSMSLAYRLSVSAKSGEAGGLNYNAANRQYFGFAEYDIDKLQITPFNSNKSPGSLDTTLAVALNPGATTITLTAGGSTWLNAGSGYNRHIIWYGYTNSFGFTYPDYTYSRTTSRDYTPAYGSAGAWASGGITGNVITLINAWTGPVVPAGTAVSNCMSGAGTFKYSLLTNGTVPNSWTRYSAEIQGPEIAGAESADRLRAGTAYIRFLHLVNYHGSADNNVRINDVSLYSVPEVILYNYANDAAAAAGNVKIGRMYHTAGAVKVRLV